MKNQKIHKTYSQARERYGDLGVCTELAMTALSKVRISLQCWQGDDVGGFHNRQDSLSGGVQVTGSYPGRARTAHELRQDLEMACRLIPGKHRLNLHAIYAEGADNVERDRLEVRHYAGWVAWARQQGMGLDFNGTFFSHEKAASGFTLSSHDRMERQFWVEHAMRCREIGAAMGKALGSPCTVNLWIPDGFKDAPVDRKGRRDLLRASLDRIFSKKFDRHDLLDALEPKLFGIGSESCVIGSHDFYFGYAIQKKIWMCLDTGHYHPTESMADKISGMMPYLEGLLLHVSRGVRWDSDHVVILTEELKELMAEIVRGDYLSKVRFGMDYFDASINRVAAWVIGARNVSKALLWALLEPAGTLRRDEKAGDYTARLAMQEEMKSMPFGAIWDEYCIRQNVPVGMDWMKQIDDYEGKVLSGR